MHGDVGLFVMTLRIASAMGFTSITQRQEVQPSSNNGKLSLTKGLISQIDKVGILFKRWRGMCRRDVSRTHSCGSLKW